MTINGSIVFVLVLFLIKAQPHQQQTPIQRDTILNNKSTRTTIKNEKNREKMIRSLFLAVIEQQKNMHEATTYSSIWYEIYFEICTCCVLFFLT